MIEDLLKQNGAAARVGDIERRRLDKSFSFSSYVLLYATRFGLGGFAIGGGLASAVLIVVNALVPGLVPLWPAAGLSLATGLVFFGLAMMWALHDQIKFYDEFNRAAYNDRISFQRAAHGEESSRLVQFNGKDSTRYVEVGHPGKDLEYQDKVIFHFPGDLVLQMREAANGGDLKVTREKFRKSDGKAFFSGPTWERLAAGQNGRGLMQAVGYWDDENEWTPEGVAWVNR